MSASPGGPPPITFSIDGVDFTTDDRRQTAAELLQLAGLSPEDHDLARLAGNSGVEHRFEDDDEIQITPRARFISIFTGSTPVA
jgi:hypothetical protein